MKAVYRAPTSACQQIWAIIYSCLFTGKWFCWTQIDRTHEHIHKQTNSVRFCCQWLNFAMSFEHVYQWHMCRCIVCANKFTSCWFEIIMPQLHLFAYSIETLLQMEWTLVHSVWCTEIAKAYTKSLVIVE